MLIWVRFIVVESYFISFHLKHGVTKTNSPAPQQNALGVVLTPFVYKWSVRLFVQTKRSFRFFVYTKNRSNHLYIQKVGPIFFYRQKVGLIVCIQMVWEPPQEPLEHCVAKRIHRPPLTRSSAHHEYLWDAGHYPTQKTRVLIG